MQRVDPTSPDDADADGNLSAEAGNDATIQNQDDDSAQLVHHSGDQSHEPKSAALLIALKEHCLAQTSIDFAV